ncbi:MAG: selenide, water dikinase SelD [Elainellaceae cyanobacterium]
MQPAPNPITQDLVLIGGGHSHAIALEKFAMNPVPGVRLTLITDVSHTPYSGMLPGYVAGLYTFDECHIDLWPLCRMAGARLILDRATGLDLENQRVHCAQHPPIAFDLLSIDIGSTPSLANVDGAEHLIPVKPISKFLTRWDDLVARLMQRSQAPTLAVVGGGAGGVELALAIEARFRRLHRQAQSAQRVGVHLFQRGDTILPNRSQMMRHRVRRQLQQRHMKLHLGQAVTAVRPMTAEGSGSEASAAARPLLVVTDRDKHPCDAVFWVTGASPAPWIATSGLETDDRGFIAVNDCLQTSHPLVFAAGDIATMVAHPRPKAGVFAVRQGQPLYENLRRSLLGEPLKSFTPQKQFLILVGTGDERAIASRGPIALGPFSLLWRWKDHIDRKFMARFAPGEAGEMASSIGAPSDSPASYGYATRKSRGGTLVSPLSKGGLGGVNQDAAPMHCSGCGAKVGSDALSAALKRVQAERPGAIPPGVVMGLGAADDAAVIQPPAHQLWVQTVDYFPALIDDPFLLGKITAHHCLNDLWAMGATPHSVLAIATLPYATSAKHEELLYHLLSGVNAVLQQEGAALLGGHTTEGETLALGLTCNGTVPPERLLKKSGLGPGQALILTKALGTGTLFAAAQQRQTKGRWLEGAIAAMVHSNAAAADCLQQHGATACTDVTGFGLLGHLLEMVTATAEAGNPVGASLRLNHLPLLPGTDDTLAQGILSSLHPQNQQAESRLQNASQARQHPRYPILFDPQTSGGLLAAVPQTQAKACLTALQELGYTHSAIIGAVDPPESMTTGKPVRIEG